MESKAFTAVVAAGMAIALLFGTAAATPPLQDAPPLLVQPDISNPAAVLLAQQNAAAREREAALLRQYEQSDFDVMRGVVYEPLGAEE